MPYDPARRAFVLSTYRDYLDASYCVSAHCYDLSCRNHRTLDLAALASRFGMDAEFRPGDLRCSRCGGRNVQIRISYELRRDR